MLVRPQQVLRLLDARREGAHAPGMPELPQVLPARAIGAAAARRSVSDGQLVRVRRGSYRKPTPSAAQPWEHDEQEVLGRCVAVAGQFTTAFAFSHETAALLYDWPVPVSADLHLVQRVTPGYARRTGVRRHWRPDLRDTDVILAAGLPATNPLRTLIDCLRTLHPRDGLVVADAALADLAQVDMRKREESEHRQRDVLAAAREVLVADRGGRGVVRARAVLALADGFSGSPGESRTRWLALTAGLPVPVCQWEHRIDGRRFFSDIAWLRSAPDWTERGITLEYDGEEKYGVDARAAAAAVLEEKEREDAIRSTGVVVHRVTKARISSASSARRWMLGLFPRSVLAHRTLRPELLSRQPLSDW